MPSTASFNSSALAACAPSTMLRMVPLPRGAGEDQFGDPYPAGSLLDDDLAAHVRVHRTDVVVGPGLVENGGEFLAAVDRLRTEDAVGTDDIVRFFVTVDPGDGRAWLYRQDRRHELKALDRDLGLAGCRDLLRHRLLLGDGTGAEREEGRCRDGNSPPRHKTAHD